MKERVQKKITHKKYPGVILHLERGVNGLDIDGEINPFAIAEMELERKNKNESSKEKR